MKRLALMTIAALLAAAPLGEAAAREHGRDHRRDREAPAEAAGPRGEGPRRGISLDDDRPPPPPRDNARRAAPPGNARGFAPPQARRGFLPDGYRDGVVTDYPRYRLRPPPRGYAWVRVGDGFALVSLDDGRVYDMVR